MMRSGGGRDGAGRSVRDGVRAVGKHVAGMRLSDLQLRDFRMRAAVMAGCVLLGGIAAAAQEPKILIPSRKPGMWELKMEAKRQPDVTMQLCVDAENDKDMMDAWLTMVTSICPDQNWSRQDGVIVIDSDCQSSGTTVIARAELSGDFQREYTLKIHSETGLGEASKVDLVHTTRWVGEACTGGLIPGGVRLPNGAKMNMKRMMKLLENMNEQQR